MTVRVGRNQPKQTSKNRDETFGPRPEEIEASGVFETAPEDSDLTDKLRDPLGRRSATAKRDDGALSGWQKFESLFRLASLAAISASVVLASVQFYNERVDARKERSIALMNAWQTAEARGAYAHLSGVIEIAIQETGPIPANIPDKARGQVKYNIGDALIKNWRTDDQLDYPALSDNIDSVFDFYTEIYFCIQAKLCDETLLRHYFTEEVVSFWEYFESYAELRREGLYPNYGTAVENLVVRLGS